MFNSERQYSQLLIILYCIFAIYSIYKSSQFCTIVRFIIFMGKINVNFILICFIRLFINSSVNNFENIKGIIIFH